MRISPRHKPYVIIYTTKSINIVVLAGPSMKNLHQSANITLKHLRTTCSPAIRRLLPGPLQITLISILILGVYTVFSASPARAAVITITSKLDTADPGRCRLRDAITASNTNTATGDCPAGEPGMDTIGFDLGDQCSLIPCTITLTNTFPTVTEDLIIDGNNTILDGANTFRVFDLGAVTVNISDLSIKNGNTAGLGGAINMSGDISTTGTTLTLSNVFFSNNHADFGGAIYFPRGTLTIINSNFSGNTAGAGGGAIVEESNGMLIVDATIFNNNTAVNRGGAMGIGGEAHITHSSFSGNSASSGGAIEKFLAGDLVLDSSIFVNNTANFQSPTSGGGAFHLSDTGNVALINTTISGNHAMGNGGGIFNQSATLALNNVTVTDNTADSDNDGIGDGGGIYRETGSVQVQNTIIADNFDTPGGTGMGIKIPDCSGTFLSQGYNIIGVNDGCNGFSNGVNADIVGTLSSPIDPLLDTLADNGGPTQTHALLPGSPAINAGDPLLPGSGGLACAATDQRGVARPEGTTCDIGAFEFKLWSVSLPIIIR